MRPLILATIAAIALSAGAGATTATEPASQAGAGQEQARSTPLTASEARKVVREHMEAKKMRNVRIGDTRQADGRYHVKIQSADGIPVGTVVVDAATGKVVN